MDEEEDPKIPWLRGEEAWNSAVETVTLVRGRGVTLRESRPCLLLLFLLFDPLVSVLFL